MVDKCGKFFINNQWVYPEATRSKSSFEIINPATEQIIASIPNASRGDVDTAFHAARLAFNGSKQNDDEVKSKGWRYHTGVEKAEYLVKLAEKVEEHLDELCDLEAINTGKPWEECKWDMEDVAGCLKYYADIAAKLDSTREYDVDLGDADYHGRVTKEPTGVVSAIVPWNYPLLMAIWKIAPALAAGCTVVLKPSELTPLTILKFCEFVAEVDLPAGVLNVLTGVGKVTGEMMINHKEADKIAFTGSVPVGQHVMRTAATNLADVTLELGGKSAAIVFDDVDIDITVEWIMFGCFWTNGQICSATSRLLIHESIKDRFLKRLVECVNQIPIVNPMSDAKTKSMKGVLGPLIDKKQQTNALKHVQGAVQQGATVLCGGEAHSIDGKGFFVRPTVLEADPSMDIWRTEIFAPVLSVMSFKTEEEALALANDSEFGLGGAVFSGDLARCQRVCNEIRTGIVWINCSQPCFSQLPWGGMKKSGIGRELGVYGVNNYLQDKSIVTKVDAGTPLDWYSHVHYSKL